MTQRRFYDTLQLTAEGDFVMPQAYEEYCNYMDMVDAYAEH